MSAMLQILVRKCQRSRLNNGLTGAFVVVRTFGERLDTATTSSTPELAAGISASSDASPAWWLTVATAVAAFASASAATSALADAPKTSNSSNELDAAADQAADGVRNGSSKLLSLPMRQRIFFKYEKRIKDLSTLEKIFDYFATHEKDGARVMTSQDVVRALVPTYPPVGSQIERAGFLAGERVHSQSVSSVHGHILHFFDHNQDGTISFNEFVLLVISLSVPEKDVEVVFDIMDLDDNGVLSEDEFRQVLEQLERHAGIQASFHNRTGQHHIVDSDRQMVHRLFQDETGGVKLHKFRSFLQRLQQGMLKLEFAHYDSADSGYICGADFAHSLVTAADIRAVDRYLDRVDAMSNDLATSKISFRDFSAVANLRQHFYMLSFALDFCFQIERPITRAEFTKLTKKTLGMKLSPAVLDIIFYMFDDGAGNLDGPGFVDVMKRRNKVPGYRKGKGLGVDQEVSGHSTTPVVDWLRCIRDCSFGGNH